MSLVFNIKSYKGVGIFNFGASENEVETILGTPTTRNISDYHPSLRLDPVIETRYDDRNISLAFSLEGNLQYIAFQKNSGTTKFRDKLFLNEVNCFEDLDAFERIITQDKAPYEWAGFVMLMDLGLRLGGFHEEDDAGPTIAMFIEGRYNDKLKRFKLLT